MLAYFIKAPISSNIFMWAHSLWQLLCCSENLFFSFYNFKVYCIVFLLRDLLFILWSLASVLTDLQSQSKGSKTTSATGTGYHLYRKLSLTWSCQSAMKTWLTDFSSLKLWNMNLNISSLQKLFYCSFTNSFTAFLI